MIYPINFQTSDGVLYAMVNSVQRDDLKAPTNGVVRGTLDVRIVLINLMCLFSWVDGDLSLWLIIQTELFVSSKL